MFSYLSRSILNAFIFKRRRHSFQIPHRPKQLGRKRNWPSEFLSDSSAVGNCPFRDARHATHEFEGHTMGGKLEYDRKTSVMFNNLRKKYCSSLIRRTAAYNLY
ncbi:hypothetical protein I7I50_07459 [Histoplasma capsulatum G186AR]|uniref:Uncharacterized protein n=1 Tax=Ajellomyces capsulatus TaxID=5037 RepID=A0A8H7YWH8_AJECA|nr:hypothetical protein I7I52_09469 [Histoplasma capsulatum]QSS68153.1 hypothetical protein I7I50_07459 [Histoplasma capsulatum G186AR]